MRTSEDFEQVPDKLGHYEILSPLGKGGMGQVFLARDPRLGRTVALKLLPEELAADAQRLERFQREARLASALNHPHICTVYDIGEDHGRFFIVMELVDGQTLGEFAAGEPAFEDLIRCGGQVARALAAAHAAGIAHRDIKPDNIMVRSDGYVKVLDFGIARTVAPTARDGGERSDVTEPGTLIGTVRYMSPEQARGDAVGIETDLFSLGIVLYELATGTHPFEADSQLGVLTAILTGSPVSPRQLNPQIPELLAGLIEELLQKNATLRPTAEYVESVLEALKAPGTPHVNTSLVRMKRRSVGRVEELTKLRAAFDSVAAGQGLIECVSGEPGVGKTTLIEDFLGELASSGRDFLLGRGRCSERLAGTEAYVPVLEALESLLQDDAGSELARIMKVRAPTWYAEVVPLAIEDDSTLERSLEEAKTASQQRLQRELGAFLAEASSRRPVVLFIDDMHWADASTVDLLVYLGGRLDAIRSLVLASYRPTDLAISKHPFGPVKLDLQARGVCHDLELGFLTRGDIERYLALEFPEHDFPDDFVDLVYRRTEGSPLFMADLLRYLQQRQVIRRNEDQWILDPSIADIENDLPESVRSMIQRKIEQLDDEDRHLLSVASVQGFEFDSAVLAAAAKQEPADVEERLAALASVHGFVRLVKEQEFPDRTLTLRYVFVHVLYQNALYAALQPTRRRQLSAAVAESLLARYGNESSSVAAELALLFKNARDFSRAADFCLLAAQNAVRVYANREAVLLAQAGLQHLDVLPESPERARKELLTLIVLGPPLKETAGWTSPEVHGVYERAENLCRKLGSSPEFFPALWGLWLFRSGSSEIPGVREHVRELVKIAEENHDQDMILQAQHALWTTHAIAGDWGECCSHVEEGMALYDLQEHSEHKFLYGAHDPGACGLSFQAQSLWMLGYPDRAVEKGRESLELAQQTAQPASIAMALHALAMVHYLRRDIAETLENGEACQRIVDEHGIPFHPHIFVAWALFHDGRREEGLRLMEQAIAKSAQVQLFLRVPFLVAFADLLGQAGAFDDALRILAEAREIVARTEVGHSTPEVDRLEGEILLVRDPEARSEAEVSFRRALQVARRQNSKSMELRALMSLSRLQRRSSRQGDADSMLRECYGWFTEGFETADLREAIQLLEGR